MIIITISWLAMWDKSKNYFFNLQSFLLSCITNNYEKNMNIMTSYIPSIKSYVIMNFAIFIF
uniref:Uncharacterized protein n=1 Tax=Octopus bimaculoides TaxID=37653 RepID=A0A0L8GM56_OCTBM